VRTSQGFSIHPASGRLSPTLPIYRVFYCLTPAAAAPAPWRADGRTKTDRRGGTLRKSLGELGTRVSASFMRRDRQFRMGSFTNRVGARMHGQCQLLTKHFGNLLTRYVTRACGRA
jgi:hypothetical protein